MLSSATCQAVVFTAAAECKLSRILQLALIVVTEQLPPKVRYCPHSGTGLMQSVAGHTLLGRTAFRHDRTFAVARRAAQPRRRALVVSNMFTGIVQGTAAVADLESKENFKAFKIRFPNAKADGVQIGASVAINGTCLTVTAIDGDVLSFDVMQETLRATSLGNLQV